MTEPTAAQAPPVHLVRPDGSVQVGFGPGSWLVRGWSPDASEHDPLTAVVRGMTFPAGAGGRRAPVRGWEVRGRGALAGLVRDRLGRALREVPGAAYPEEQVAPSALVLVVPYAVPVGTARRPDLMGRPVLPVVAQPRRVVVGPWTGLPGTPCLHCLDLHRRDRDPDWPALVAGVDDPLSAPPPPHPEGPLLELVASVVTLLVVSCCSGEAVDAGAATELGPAAPHVVVRRWEIHPACPWHDAPERTR